MTRKMFMQRDKDDKFIKVSENTYNSVLERANRII